LFKDTHITYIKNIDEKTLSFKKFKLKDIYIQK